jgi:hypothetical protein
MSDWIQVVSNARPLVLLLKQEIFLLDVFKDQFTLVIWVIHAINTKLVVIAAGMTSQLYILVNTLFKESLKQSYSEWLLVGDHILTL